MMFRWINKQPGIQKFWNLCGHYQDIYDWISPLNKWSGLPFILKQQSMGELSKINLVICLFFTSLKHLMVLLRCSFSGLHFYTLSKTLIACRDMQLRFFKVKTLLNNACKLLYHLCFYWPSFLQQSKSNFKLTDFFIIVTEPVEPGVEVSDEEDESELKDGDPGH